MEHAMEATRYGTQHFDGPQAGPAYATSVGRPAYADPPPKAKGSRRGAGSRAAAASWRAAAWRMAIASYETAASDVRCLCGVRLKGARRAGSGQECAASGAWGQARDISPSGLSQLQRVRFVRKGVAECQDTPQRQRSPLSPKANTTPAHRRDTAPAAGPQTLSPPAAG